jgi:hypothetical protein
MTSVSIYGLPSTTVGWYRSPPHTLSLFCPLRWRRKRVVQWSHQFPLPRTLVAPPDVIASYRAYFSPTAASVADVNFSRRTAVRRSIPAVRHRRGWSTVCHESNASERLFSRCDRMDAYLRDSSAGTRSTGRRVRIEFATCRVERSQTGCRGTDAAGLPYGPALDGHATNEPCPIVIPPRSNEWILEDDAASCGRLR